MINMLLLKGSTSFKDIDKTKKRKSRRLNQYSNVQFTPLVIAEQKNIFSSNN